MDFRIIATGSKGNCYTLSDGVTTIMLECGISPKKMMNAGVKLSEIAGCLITHGHKDHCEYAGELSDKYGIPIYASAGTFKEMSEQQKQHLGMVKDELLCQKEVIYIGSFSVLPMLSCHDTTEPMMFLIHSAENGMKMLFTLDTREIPYSFKDLTHIAVECNWSEKIVKSKAADSDRPLDVIMRQLDNHMSCEKLAEWLNGIDFTQMRELYLLHVSKEFGDPELFQREACIEFGVNTYIK